MILFWKCLIIIQYLQKPKKHRELSKAGFLYFTNSSFALLTRRKLTLLVCSLFENFKKH